MGYVINERNSGNWSLDGEPKRRKESKKLTEEDKYLIAQVLRRVYMSLEYDETLSEGHGHLHPDSVVNDGGRFLINMTKKDADQLWDIIYKKLDINKYE
jgi:hypothetical protein